MQGTGTIGEVARAAPAFAGEADQAVLDETLNEIAGHLNAQHGRLVDATVELLAHPERWRGDGVWKPAQYLCWRVGLAPHRARQVVSIAERVEELPMCVQAFRRGELTVDAMATIAKRAPWWTDKNACTYGQTMTISQLRGVLAKYPFPHIAHPDTEADQTSPADSPADSGGHAVSGEGDDRSGERRGQAEPENRCGFGWDDSGRFRLNAATDAETGAIIETAFTEARDALFRDSDAEFDWVAVLREVCDRSLDTITEPSRRDRYRINLHLDTDANAVDAVGRRLPDSVRRHLTCDGLLSPVFVEHGIPVSVGRTQRIVPDRTRRHVLVRDQGCRMPGCDGRKFLEVHHIVHWEHDGPTDTWNLICLCPHHHRLHHQGKIGIAGNADIPGGVIFTNAFGNPVAQSGAKPEPPGGPPPKPVGTYRHPIGERLETKWVYFNPPRGHCETANRPQAPPWPN